MLIAYQINLYSTLFHIDEKECVDVYNEVKATLDKVEPANLTKELEARKQMIEMSAPKIKEIVDKLVAKQEEEAKAKAKEEAEKKEEDNDISVSDIKTEDVAASTTSTDSSTGRYLMLGAGLALIAGLGFTMLRKTTG